MTPSVAIEAYLTSGGRVRTDPTSRSAARGSTIVYSAPCPAAVADGACAAVVGSGVRCWAGRVSARRRSEEHTSELQSRGHLVCRLLLEKKKESTDQQIQVEYERVRRIERGVNVYKAA